MRDVDEGGAGVLQGGPGLDGGRVDVEDEDVECRIRKVQLQEEGSRFSQPSLCCIDFLHPPPSSLLDTGRVVTADATPELSCGEHFLLSRLELSQA